MKKCTVVFFLYLAICCASCSSIVRVFKPLDFKVAQGYKAEIPSVIIIGSVEKRNVTYDQYISSNFRDLLKYHLFKYNYNVLILPNPPLDVNMQFEARKKFFSTLKDLYGSTFVYLTGVVTESEFGTGISLDTSVSVMMSLYDSEGVCIAEGVIITDDTLIESNNLNKVADLFADKIDRIYKK